MMFVTVSFCGVADDALFQLYVKVVAHIHGCLINDCYICGIEKQIFKLSLGESHITKETVDLLFYFLLLLSGKTQKAIKILPEAQ